MDIKRLKVNPRLFLILFKYKQKFIGLLLEMARERVNRAGEKIVEFFHSPQVIFRALHKRLPASMKKTIKKMHWLQNKAYELGLVSRGARCYVVSNMTKLEFVTELENRGVEYVLLRWWQNFPEFPEGEDMDILMRPKGFEKIKDLITYKKNDNKCDIYLLNGERPGHWNHIPYFPNKLFEQTIQTAVLHNNLVRVPDAFHYFATMGYHALYHKGCKSGLQGIDKSGCEVEHDYQSLLESRVKELSLSLKEVTAESIHSFLMKNGFAPGTDTLSKIVDVNPELEFLLPQIPKNKNSVPEMAVYLIRETAVKDGLTRDFLRVFEDMKFDIIDSTDLDVEQKIVAKNELRGGKWDSAGYETKAGGPAIMVTVLDYFPKKPSNRLKKKYRWLTNSNVLSAKRACRKVVLQKKWFKYYNPIHCADYEIEALEYLNVVYSKEKVELILAEVDERKLLYKTGNDVVKLLSKGRRSKVELIKYDSTDKAVKKTFRKGCEKFFERELNTLRKFQGESFCPELLQSGENFYIVKYYESIINYESAADMKAKLSGNRSKIMEVIKTMHENNLTFINFTPENVLLTASGELKAIDFEFVQSYGANTPKSPADAYEVRGVPKGFKGDLPRGFDYRNSSYSVVWQYYLGRFDNGV